MSNRPPQPTDLIWYNVNLLDYEYVIPEMGREFDAETMNCMQEALTCEWLIEHGFIPDPTEFLSDGKYRGRTTAGWHSVPYHWTCEVKNE